MAGLGAVGGGAGLGETGGGIFFPSTEENEKRTKTKTKVYCEHCFCFTSSHENQNSKLPYLKTKADHPSPVIARLLSYDGLYMRRGGVTAILVNMAIFDSG